jgi:outer membrane protein assembly factor BamA
MKPPSWLLAIFARSVLVCICLSCSSTLTLAQSKQTIISQIAVEGSARFSDSQVSAASGLKPGQPADNSILNSAADRLSKTGAFSEVTYRYETLNGKMRVTLIVVDEPKTMSCTFDNFVWFAQDEIDRAVRAEVPLYDGHVPVNGDLARDVALALERLLAQHHLATSVTFLPAAKRIGSIPTEFRYSATDNLPPVTSVEFTGGPLDPALFGVAKQRLMGRPFSAAYAHSLAENDLDVIYQNQAYLRAHFGDPQVTFLPSPNNSDPGGVKLMFIVVPGPMYAWHGADWAGNSAYSSADLEHFFGMKDGDPAGLDKISAGMDAVRVAYGQKGYIVASLSPKQNLDDAARQVRYSIQLKEGNQYRMGLLTVSGFDDSTAGRIRKAWRLKAGDIYDASYQKEFIRKDLSGALSGSPAAGRVGRISMSQHPNQDTLTVDMAISLSAN